LNPSEAALTPINFLDRTNRIFGGRIAIKDLDTEKALDYSQFVQRTGSLAAAIKRFGTTKWDNIAFLSLNSTALLEAHFAVPLAKRVLVAMNYRLTPKEIYYVIRHSRSKVLFFDSRLSKIVSEIEGKLRKDSSFKLIRIGEGQGRIRDDGSYEDFVKHGKKGDMQKEFKLSSERSPISIDYTSGTTGIPKGVVYSHRGAYLNALADITHSGLNDDSSYLWTLPMFHCNGWCYTWATIGAGATNVVISKVEPEKVWQIIQEYSVSHLCAAPTVLVGLASVSDSIKKNIKLDRKLTILTGGAPPAPKVIENIENMGAEVIHLYGLTETYGPNTLCLWRSEWSRLSPEEKSSLKARQGVPHVNAHSTLVVDEEMNEVPRDGKTIGEVVMRGNTVMLGYYRDAKTTREAFRGGMFHSGDLAVVHADGYIELVDRKKDLIISGGEKISSIEVEAILYRHPSILEAAVIAIPDQKWGEVPKAFVSLKEGSTVSESELAEFCRRNLAHFKCPKFFEFGTLPRTSTGKVMKFALREKEWTGLDKRIH